MKHASNRSLTLVALVILLVAPSAFAQEQNEKTFRSKDIRLYYSAKDESGIKEAILFVTFDGGASWQKTDPSATEWGKDSAGRTYVIYHAKGDGRYGFAFQFIDSLGIPTPAPSAGKRPALVAVVDTAPVVLKLADILSLPKSGGEIVVTEKGVRIPYALVTAREIVRKTLWITRDEGKNWEKADGIEWSADQAGATFVRFTLSAEGRYGLAFQFAEKSGGETPHPSSAGAYIWVVYKPAVVASSILPILLEPKGSEEWTAGNVYVIKWMSPDGFKKKSASLSYSYDGGPWTLITKGLENTGFYRWAAPARATSKLTLRVTLEDASGKEVSSVPSGDIVAVVPTSPDIAAAKRDFAKATLLRSQRKYDEAIISYEDALAAWDRYPDALNDVAWVYYEMGDFGKSLEYFLKAKEVNRDSSAACAHVGYALLKLGLIEDGAKELDNAVELGVSAKKAVSSVSLALWEASQILLQRGKKEEARNACKSILKIASADKEIKEKALALLKAH